MFKRWSIIVFLATTCNQTEVITHPYKTPYYRVEDCPVDVYYRIDGVEFKECYR